MSPQQHFLIVTFPVQGHINPGLQFAKRLLRHGAHVTFATSVYANRQIMSSKQLLLNQEAARLKFGTFSDGHDDGFKPKDSSDHYMLDIRRHGPETLRDLILSRAVEEGPPITCLVYTHLLDWAAKVAADFNIPSALLWVQPATVLDIVYYHFNGNGDEICNNNNNNGLIKFPGLPLSFVSHDLPSFILPTTKENSSLNKYFKEQLDALEREANPRILVNTFNALEPDALKAIHKYKLIGVGPLVPWAFLDGKDLSDTSLRGDLFHGTKDYRSWLDSKPEASVIYISFGSIAVMSEKQGEEVARALLETAKPFLWVIRAKPNGGEEKKEEDDKVMSCMDELEQLGMIVPWCSQMEVLSHPSLGCFMSHCGWNSSLESLVSGVPVVALPQMADQGTNAKLIEDAWGTGVRVRVNGEGIVGADEIKRCLEMVMGNGEKREEMRRNAFKWKVLAREAAKEGGSSDTNLKAFVEDVSRVRR